MRKKLLALLMCATMIFSSSVVAMADEFSDAKTVLTTNGATVVGEYEGGSIISVLVDDKYKWGFDTNSENSAVRICDDHSSKTVTLKLDDSFNLTKTGNPSIGASSSYAASINLAYALYAAEYVKAGDAINAGTKIVFFTKGFNWDGDTGVWMITIGTAIDANGNASAAKLAESLQTELAVDGTSDPSFSTKKIQKITLKSGSSLTTKTASTGEIPTGFESATILKKDAKIMSGDGYSYNCSTNNNLLKGYAATSDDSDIYYTLSAISSDDKNYDEIEAAVAGSLGDSILSGKSTCAGAYLNLYHVYDDSIKGATIEQITYGSSDITLELNNDWLHQVLKLTTTNVYTISNYTTKYTKIDEEANKLSLVASAADISAAYGKFTIPAKYSRVFEGGAVIIFDQGAAASQNDGASASASTSTAPQMGDVAPVAALAVVMMGAFAAMVVASKKRV